MLQNEEVIIKPSGRFSPIDPKELWASRELLYYLVWRDVKVKYKQTFLGIAWAVFRPFIMMLVFSVIFGYFAKIPSDGVPYPIFVHTGLLIWVYFSSAVTSAGNSLLASSNLITKVYFPRLIIPVSASLSCLVEFLVAYVMLIAMMLFYNRIPGVSGIVLIPLLIFMTFLAALGCSLWLSALTVRYRDLQHIVPFALQIGMYATPVIYPVTLVPEPYRWVLAFNPMGVIIDAFRVSSFGPPPIDWSALMVSSGMIVVIVSSGLCYFRKVERSFADII